MDFNPNNTIVRLCLQGMNAEGEGRPGEARALFFQAWNEATEDLEKFIAAHYVARYQSEVSERLKWFETALQYALQINNDTVHSALPALYMNIARSYEELDEPEKAREFFEKAQTVRDNPSDQGPFYHGTKADLGVNDLLTPGGESNYQADLTMNHIYFTALVNGAGLAAALAKGEGQERVYRVEPTGSFENDPNVTDKKFPGNPTRSYRSRAPLRIVEEVTDWARISPEELRQWRERLAKNKGEIIN